MEVNELKKVLTVERELYAFLSKVITLGPQIELLNRFICAYGDISEDGEQETDELIQGILIIQNALGNDASDINEATLMNEYTRLFIGPGKNPVSPYASVYLSKEAKPKLMDENTIEVRKQYLQDNILMANINAVPDDYLGAELEYMYYLAYKSIESIQQQNSEELDVYLKKQMDFLKEHLLLWIPKFSEDLYSATNEDFFKGMAILLRGLIMSHYDILETIVDTE